MANYYVDAHGNYLGGFDGAPPPAGAIKVRAAPGDARQTWDGTAWSAPPAPPPIISSTVFLDRLGSDGPALMASPFAFMLVRLAAAGTIRLDDPDVVAGMTAAVQAGAVSADRATALLAAP